MVHSGRYVIKLDSGSSISLKRDKFMTETDRQLKAAEKKQKKRQQKQQQKFAAFQDDNSEEQEEGDARCPWCWCHTAWPGQQQLLSWEFSGRGTGAPRAAATTSNHNFF